MAETARTVTLPPYSVRADLAPRSINETERTVDLIITTTAGVRRRDWETGEEYLEVLSMDPAHVRMDRINGGAPLLDSHSSYSVSDVLGTIVPGSATLAKKALLGTARFSKRASVDDIWNDVRDGIIRNVSVGYRIYAFVEAAPAKAGKLPVRTAIDWEPFEASMVPIPADPGAKVRAGDTTDTNLCEIRSLTVDPPQEPQSPEAPAKEKTMPEPTGSFVEQNPLLQDVPPPKPAPPPPSERDLGAEAERKRCAAIHSACIANRLPTSLATELIEKGIPLEQAQTIMLAELAKRDVPDVPSRTPSGHRVEIMGEDPLIIAKAGVANALLHRVAPERHKLEDIGRPYRGMTIMDIGRALLSARGVHVAKMTRSELVDAMMARGAMHTTSDFPSLLEDVAKKNLRSAYDAAPQTWLPIASPVSLSDFKPSRQLQVGDAPGLDEILEHGEYTSGTITEAKESITLKTYGKKFAITRQALINDDLNAFGSVPAAFGRKARDKESDLAWEQITSNPTMGDGVALFHASHGNLSPFGQDLTVGHLGDGRTAMRVQKGIDGVTVLNLSPNYLIVPAALETTADQLVTQITPATVGNVNPFGPGGRTPLTVIVEPRLDANSQKAWYMACPVSQAPVLYYGTLDGQSGPDLRQQEGFDVDGIEFRCRLDVAFKAADWRAIYKDSGA